jgi:osmoprotectant transport system permease protein
MDARAAGGEPVNSTLTWLFDPAHWSGQTGIPARILEHLGYTALTVLIAAAIAIPLGAVVGHTGRGTFLVAGLSNGLRALPELGLLTLLVLLTYVGLLPVVISLVVLALPPILAGTYAGVRNVDRAVVDAARGMGMRGGAVLWRVELPNALPLILGGVRSATLQVIATATIAAYVALGGLGRFVIDGNNAGAGSPDGYPQMAAGAIVIAVLALVVEGVLGLVQRLVVSPGLRDTTTRRRVARIWRRPTPDLVSKST